MTHFTLNKKKDPAACTCQQDASTLLLKTTEKTPASLETINAPAFFFLVFVFQHTHKKGNFPFSPKKSQRPRRPLCPQRQLLETMLVLFLPHTQLLAPKTKEQPNEGLVRDAGGRCGNKLPTFPHVPAAGGAESVSCSNMCL